MLRDILALYAKRGDRILDMTYGKGAFWRGINTKQYTLVTNDLHKPADHHYDFRRIELPDESFDLIILDPPFVQSRTLKKSISDGYGMRPTGSRRTKSGHEILVTNWGVTRMPMNAAETTNLYKRGMIEAWRLLKPNGILVLKTQDEVSSGKQVWRHFSLRFFPGYKLIDLFVVTQLGKPLMRHKHQIHARKNHSFFMVYRWVE
jgi:tRNA G10  N-methylase Trm11